MNAIKPLIAIITVAALSLPVLSTAASHTSGNPEHSYDAYANMTPAVANAAALREDLASFQSQRISADGRYRYAGPEAGYRLAAPALGMHDQTTNDHVALGQSKSPMFSGSMGLVRGHGEVVTGG